jgi:phosphoribosylaminoimidazole-succinocarboxamide synthase
LVGRGLAEKLRELTIAIYERIADVALANGIIVADTKFEFGFADGELVLIDEVGTPDSSRFWPADVYTPGAPQPSFDKQFVRDHLDASGWDREPPSPELPREVVEGTSARYEEAYERLVGEPFEAFRERMGAPDDPAADTAALDRLREEHG